MVDLLSDDGLLDLGRRRASTDPAKAVQELAPKRDTTPSRNKDLDEWAAPRSKQDQCHLCGAAPRLRCRQCDQGACGKDSWVMLGLCRTCATEDRMKALHDHERRVGDNWLGQ